MMFSTYLRIWVVWGDRDVCELTDSDIPHGLVNNDGLLLLQSRDECHRYKGRHGPYTLPRKKKNMTQTDLILPMTSFS